MKRSCCPLWTLPPLSIPSYTFPYSTRISGQSYYIPFQKMLFSFFSAAFFLLPVLGAPLTPSLSPGAILLNPTSSSANTSISTNATNSTTARIAATWYAGYHSAFFPVQNVSWDKYTHAIYAFAETTGDGSMVALADSDAEVLPTFVELAHQNVWNRFLSLYGFSLCG